MSVYLKDIRDYQKLESFESIFIVPCRFCPAASFATSNDELLESQEANGR